MPKSGTGRGKSDTLAIRCATIPGHMYARHNLNEARQELEGVLAAAKGGILHRSAGKGDVMANLWFARAAHEFAAALSGSLGTFVTPEEKIQHLEFANKKLLPLCKQIVQAFITDGGMDGVRMDDGGMLAGAGDGKPNPALALPLRLNALWYTALESTGQALRGAGPMGAPLAEGARRDSSGDHFERLAGRFRRSFAKACWCDEHQRLCPPDARAKPDHGGLPDAEQLLIAMLPSSPLPRTKQKEILAQIETQALGPFGVRINHPEHGTVESPLHWAWLAEGTAGSADSGPDFDKAAALIRPAASLRQAATAGELPCCYKDGQPVGPPDLLAAAELLGALERFLGRA